MLLGQKQLKSGESRYFTIDYAKWLLPKETVEAAAAAASPDTIPALDVTAQLVGDDKVTVQVSGGLAGTQYVVEVTADTLIDNAPDANGSQTKIDCFGVDVVGECAA